MSDFLDYLQQMAQQPGYDDTTGDQTDPNAGALASLGYNDPSSNPMATAPAPDPTGSPDTNNPQEINVTANKAPPMQAQGFALPQTAAEQDPDAAKMTTDQDDEAPQATPQQIASTKDLQGLPDHTGLFGVHGTLRSVLGTLGDALLVQGGAAPMYAPKRQQEKESDALVGFAQDPAAAIGRLAAVDPKAAIAYRAQLSNEGLASDRIRQTAATAGAKQATANFTQGSRIYGQAALAYKNATTPEAQQAALNIMSAARDRYGLPSDQYTLPTDQATAAAQATAGTPQAVQQQVNSQETATRDATNARLGQQNANSRQQQAAADTMRAQKYQPPAPRAPSITSVTQPILAKVAKAGVQSLNPGQLAIYNQVIAHAQKGGLPPLGTTAPATAPVSNNPIPGLPPVAPANPQISTQPAAYTMKGWLYDAQGHPIRKAN